MKKRKKNPYSKGIKLYALFAGIDYYPKGGWKDFIDVSDGIEPLMDRVNRKEGIEKWEWYQIINLDSLEIVKKEDIY